MSKFVKGIRIWDKDAKLRHFAILAGLPPDSAPRTFDLDVHLKRALAGDVFGVPYETEVESFECAFAPLVDSTGSSDGAVAVFLDAVERRRAEATLRERLAFEELITTLSTQLVSLGVDAVEDGVNEALRAIGEFARVDRSYVFRFTADGSAMNNTHEWCAPGVEPAMPMMQGVPLEVFPWWTSRLLRDRQLVHVPDIQQLPPEAAAERESLSEQGVKSLLALPMIYEGAVVGFLGFDSVRVHKEWPESDVALLRIAGEILVSALERKAAEERRRALETQLVQSRSLENVARLAGGVAHDFNNLLAVILNYAALIRSELTNDTQRERIRELSDAAERAADLTRQLMLLGRRDVVQPLLIDVNAVIRGLTTLVKKAIGESVELRLELTSDTGLVRIGLPQLEQIVLNLAINARDAMSAQGGVLVVKTEETDLDPGFVAKFIDLAPGRYLRLSIVDTGSGMTPEVAARAFEPFFTTKAEKGNGLGLSTVHGIVKQAGGHVTITTAVGNGTTVDVFFPIDRDRDGVAVEPCSAPADDAPLGRGECILVVEDSASLRKIMCEMLAKSGYRTLDAPTTDGALELVARHRGEIDLLVTDVIMPKMSGRELAERARAGHGLSRVLYVSGYQDDIIARHGVLEPGIELLQKPFREAELLRAVRKVLDLD